MDQRRRLQRLARRFVGQFLGRQIAQFVVDQRPELTCCLGVALIDNGQDSGNLAHRQHRNSVCGL